MLTRLYHQWYLSLYCSAYQLFKKFYETNSSGDPSKDTASIMTIEGRAYPVDIHYLQRLEMLYFGFPNTDQLTHSSPFTLFHPPLFPSLLLPHRPVANYLTATTETVLSVHREGKPGDVLAFLTGQEEVEKTVAELRLFIMYFLLFLPSLPPSHHLPERGGEREEGQRDSPKFGHTRDRVCVFNLCCQH